MRAGRLGAAAVAAALLLAASATPAAGHGEYDPAVRAAVDDVAPALDGLDVRVVGAGGQRLQLANESAEPVEVLASTGEPWLRVGPDGVEANVRSPTWWASGNPDGIYRAPAGTKATAPPRWRPVIDEPRWTWYAHELHPATVAARVPPDVLKAGRAARLGDWRIRLRAGGRSGAVRGHLDYRPARGAVAVRLTSPSTIAPGVTAAALTARAPGLFVSNTGTAPVTVDGSDGRPFARVGPRRTQIDVASPTYREQPDFAAGPPAGPGVARPRWRAVPGGATLSWIEPRARFPRAEPARDVLARDRPTVLDRWSVGLRVGERRTALRGETLWVPVVEPGTRRSEEGTDDASGLILGGALALVLLVGGALALRTRRRTAA